MKTMHLFGKYTTKSDTVLTASCMRVYGNSSCTSNNQPVWWDVECDTLKSSKYRTLRRFRITNDAEDLISIKKERKYLRIPFL